MPRLRPTGADQVARSHYRDPEYEQVLECLSAIAPIERRGMDTLARTELAAAIMAMAMSHVRDALDCASTAQKVRAVNATKRAIAVRAVEIYEAFHSLKH